jgi:hypothetical protein
VRTPGRRGPRATTSPALDRSTTRGWGRPRARARPILSSRSGRTAEAIDVLRFICLFGHLADDGVNLH